MVQNAYKGRKQEKGGGKGREMAYDDVIISLGQFGRYQKRIYVLLCLPAISCALHKLAGVFLQAKVAHRCQLPWEDGNATYPLESAKLPLIFPWDNGLKQWSSCRRYDTNFTEEYFEGGIHGNATVGCVNWIYDTTRYSSTTITEWDLVCDKNWVKATADALLMVGVMLGSIIFGDLSDRVGRKPIFFLSLVLQVIFGVAASLAPDEYTFMISRMIVGATTSGVFLVAYVIAMEMVGPKRRMLCGVGFQLFFTAGFVLTAGFAYFLRDWRHLQLAITLPGVVFFCYWWFIPESVRWQLTKGKTDLAKSTLMAVAKENNKKLDENLLSDLFTQAEADQKSDLSSGTKPSLLDLFKHRNLRNKLVNSGTYYGLSWNTSDLGGNDFVNFIISGAVEVPAYTFLIFTLDRWGRKVILCGSMILGGLCLVAAIFVPKGMAWLNITLAMCGKLAITASYGTVYVLTAEQFPTVIRNVALGAGSTFARVGGILAPYINYTSEIWTPLPLIIFGIMALISGTSAMVLPETLNKKLPETIEDGEQFGKKEKKKEVAQPEEQVALKERNS